MAASIRIMAKMYKEIGFGVNWATRIFAALSILGFVERAVASQYSKLLQRLLDFYNSITHFFLSWTEPFWNGLFDLQLEPHWRDVFVLLIFYIGADVRSHSQRRRYINAVVGSMAGPILALAGALGSGAVPIDPAKFSPLALIFPATALATLALIFCVLTSSFYPSLNQRWIKTFTYYLINTALPFAIVPMLAAGVGFWAEGKLPNPTMIALLAYIFLLPTYWLIRGVALAFTTRGPNESFGQRFAQTGGAKISRNILIVIAIAIIIALTTAGLPFFGIG